MAANKDYDLLSKRRRHLTDDYPSPNVDLRLKLMGDSLKARLGCEIEAFCSNAKSLLSDQERRSLKTHFSPPPQLVPQNEPVCSTSAVEYYGSPDEEAAAQQVYNQESFEPRTETPCESDVESVQELHSKLLSLTLQFINLSNEKLGV